MNECYFVLMIIYYFFIILFLTYVPLVLAEPGSQC